MVVASELKRNLRLDLECQQQFVQLGVNSICARPADISCSLSWTLNEGGQGRTMATGPDRRKFDPFKWLDYSMAF